MIGLSRQRRLDLATLLGGVGTARGESAPGRRRCEIGWQTRDAEQRLVARLGQERYRPQQRLRVGVMHVREQLVGASTLDHPAGVHHVDPVGPPGDHAHVVGDRQHRHPEALLEPVQQAEDLGLDGDVERGGGLVGQQHLRLAGERHARPVPHGLPAPHRENDGVNRSTATSHRQMVGSRRTEWAHRRRPGARRLHQTGAPALAGSPPPMLTRTGDDRAERAYLALQARGPRDLHQDPPRPLRVHTDIAQPSSPQERVGL